MLVPAVVAVETVLPVPMAVLLRPQLASPVLLPPLPQPLSFQGYRKDFFFNYFLILVFKLV